MVLWCVRLNLGLGGGQYGAWGEQSFCFAPGHFTVTEVLECSSGATQLVRVWSPFPTRDGLAPFGTADGASPVFVVTIYLFSRRLKHFLVSIRSSRARTLILNSQSFSCKQMTK